MATFRASPTWLNAYKLYLNTDWMTTEKLVSQIRSEEPPNEQMLLGTAVHKYIEDGSHSEEFDIDYASIDEVMADLRLDVMLHELRGSRNLMTEYGEIQINSLADGILGLMLYEWKTTTGTIQLDKYIDSMQWKVCAWVFELPRIEYRIMQLKQGRKKDDTTWKVTKSEVLPLVWNDRDMIEINHMVNGFIDFCLRTDLEAFIQPRDEVQLLEAS